MNKEGREKINAVGQSMGVDFSQVNQTRRRVIGRIMYGIIQGLVALGSTLLATGFGVNVSDYPYSDSFWNNLGQGLFFETVIHTGNGILSLPGEQRFGLSRSQRLRFFFGNLIISFTLFMISFEIHSHWGVFGGGIRYSVFDNRHKLTGSIIYR